MSDEDKYGDDPDGWEQQQWDLVAEAGRTSLASWAGGRKFASN